MLKWYQRRTQKGMGRIEKITLTGVTKNPRLLKACNTTAAMCDMGEFFFISLMNEIDQIFNYTKKNIFLNVGQFFLGKFLVIIGGKRLRMRLRSRSDRLIASKERSKESGERPAGSLSALFTSL